MNLDLAGRMTRNPYQTMFIAAGVGYILGGGLFTRFTLNACRVGVRMGALPILQRELINVAAAISSGAPAPDAGSGRNT